MLKPIQGPIVRHHLSVALLCLAAFVFVVCVPEDAWAQPDLGGDKLQEFQGALKKVAIAAIGVAGILAGIYVAFGRQDGNERLGAVIKGAIVVSVVVGVVSYLAG